MIVGLQKTFERDDGAEGNFWRFEGFNLRVEDIPNHSNGGVVTIAAFQVWFKIYKNQAWHSDGKPELDRRVLSVNAANLDGIVYTPDPEGNRQWVYENAPLLFAELAGASPVMEE